MEDLSQGIALVTGASSGIGRRTAEALASEGADVVLASRTEEKLVSLANALEEEHGVDTLVVPTNVRDEDEVRAMVSAAIDEFGRLDVVVSNAGVGAPGTPIHELPTDEYRWLMETNVDGTFFTTRAVLPHLRETDGHLIFVGSLAGQYPRPATPLYAAAKWWIRGFALSVDGMYGTDGVAVTVVNQAEVRTELEVLETALTEQFEPGEITEPEEVAEAIAYAASQTERTTVSEVNLHYRGKLSQF